MSNYDETEVQYDSYDEGEQGDGLIRIQSRHGNPETGSVFRFFLGKDNVPEGFTPGAPWVAHKEYIKSAGKHIEGWKAEALPMMIICARAQAFRKGKDEKREAWVDSWPKDAPPNSHGMHCDVLLIARGLEELGPVVWSTNGASTSFAIISGKGKRQPQGGILERIRNEVLAEADRLSQFSSTCIAAARMPTITRCPSGAATGTRPRAARAAWRRRRPTGISACIHRQPSRPATRTARSKRRCTCVPRSATSPRSTACMASSMSKTMAARMPFTSTSPARPGQRPASGRQRRRRPCLLAAARAVAARQRRCAPSGRDCAARLGAAGDRR
jgi:hypothetical protein